MNVTAAAFPMPLKPDFYYFDYAVPSYNIFELFITIITSESTNRVCRNIPVLFAWLIVTGAIGVAANARRCRLARTQLDHLSAMSKGSNSEESSQERFQSLILEKTTEDDFASEALSV